MSDLINKQYILAARPNGLPTEDDVPLQEGPVPTPGEGELVLRHLYISLDPAIRGWMRDAPNYIPPIELGDPVRSSVIARVEKSESPDFDAGDIVMAMGSWALYSVLPAVGITKITSGDQIPLSHYLSILGPTGLTAYFGLLDVGMPKAGETVLVSAAAGAVGSIVGQIAKLKGCRVVGLAGSDEKCRWVSEDLGFDNVINYKKADNMAAAIADACPEGVDIYFDNVGGGILDAALLNLNHQARVVVCGWISTYNDKTPQPGPSNLWQLVAKSVRMQGFVIVDYIPRFVEGLTELGDWLMAGKLQFKEEVVDGLDNCLPTFLRLFDGSNNGKLIIKVEDENS